MLRSTGDWSEDHPDNNPDTTGPYDLGTTVAFNIGWNSVYYFAKYDADDTGIDTEIEIETKIEMDIEN